MTAVERAGPCAAVDVHYPQVGADAAVVIAEDPTFARITDERVVHLPQAEPYQPGAFALRELPPILAVLAGVTGLQLLVVDGYVDLDPQGRPGLGAHAHAALEIPVIGVAKTPFHAAEHAVPVHRGGALRPLYVTAAGLTLQSAAECVRVVAGPHRIPDALRRVDALARGRASPQTPPA